VQACASASKWKKRESSTAQQDKSQFQESYPYYDIEKHAKARKAE
jgi:hypothetical protein